MLEGPHSVTLYLEVSCSVPFVIFCVQSCIFLLYSQEVEGRTTILKWIFVQVHQVLYRKKLTLSFLNTFLGDA